MSQFGGQLAPVLERELPVGGAATLYHQATCMSVSCVLLCAARVGCVADEMPLPSTWAVHHHEVCGGFSIVSIVPTSKSVVGALRLELENISQTTIAIRSYDYKTCTCL